MSPSEILIFILKADLQNDPNLPKLDSMSKLSLTIKNLRTDFFSRSFDRKDVSSSPIRQFENWMTDAINAKIEEPNAMTLATVDKAGQPDARVVLLRDVSAKGFSFFTNYQSKKGKDMSKRNKVCLNFYWTEVGRQVRIHGSITKLPAKNSDEYFHSRPRESQLGAWASHQSEELNNRKELINRLEQIEEKYKGKIVPRPAHWGGYLVQPTWIEFWQGRQSRLHDRIVYKKLRTGKWKIVRLNP